MKFRNPMIVRSVDLPRGITFVLNPIMGTKEDPGIDNLPTGLLVLTQMCNSHMTEGMRKIDDKLGGALKKALEDNNFQARAGEHVLLDCREIKGACQKYILVVGLGQAKKFNSFSVCGLMRLALETAKNTGVTKLTLPFIPNRLSERNVSLAASANTLICRVRMFMDDLPKLEEIELFCTPQARPYLQDGMLGHTPRCMVCRNPELGKE